MNPGSWKYKKRPLDRHMPPSVYETPVFPIIRRAELHLLEGLARELFQGLMHECMAALCKGRAREVGWLLRLHRISPVNPCLIKSSLVGLKVLAMGPVSWIPVLLLTLGLLCFSAAPRWYFLVKKVNLMCFKQKYLQLICIKPNSWFVRLLLNW